MDRSSRRSWRPSVARRSAPAAPPAPPAVPHLRAFTAFARATALEAGGLIRAASHRRRQIGFKGAIDLVTDTDTRSERLIARRIRRRFPDHDIRGEEGVNLDRGARFQWIVDPLDGTTNFAHGFPNYCVSIALALDGEPLVGVVYQPCLEELFVAVRGRGATLNGRRLAVSREHRLGRSLLATGFPYDIRENPDQVFHRFLRLSLSAQAVRRAGAAAIDLCYVAAGRFDGFWEARLFAWDVAAGGLMVREAGGRLTDFSGREFRLDGREVVASNGRIHRPILAALRGREGLDEILAQNTHAPAAAGRRA
ncbi:MAG: inositol monophosphatase [Planctomycetes bacterium]|nr:inositol monophosphatase [Planctomycetota bacterium]